MTSAKAACAALLAVALAGCAHWYERQIPVLDGSTLRDYTVREGEIGRCVMGATLPESYEVKRPLYTLQIIPHPSLSPAAPDFELTLKGAGDAVAKAIGADLKPLGEEAGAKRYRLV